MALKKFSLQKAFEELDTISEWFGREDIDLDFALEKYQRGMALIKECQAYMKRVENEIKRVVKTDESEDKD